jgi:hypothetical protein
MVLRPFGTNGGRLGCCVRTDAVPVCLLKRLPIPGTAPGRPMATRSGGAAGSVPVTDCSVPWRVSIPARFRAKPHAAEYGITGSVARKLPA